MHCNSLSTNKKIIATTNPDLWYSNERTNRGNYEMLSKEDGINKANFKPTGIAKIDTTFIEAYVKEQGKIDKVLVEYESAWEGGEPVVMEGTVNFNDLYELKLKPNGSVIVHPVKEKMYSKEEHIVNLTKYRLHYEQFRKDSYFGPNEREIANWSNKWIEQNL